MLVCVCKRLKDTFSCLFFPSTLVLLLLPLLFETGCFYCILVVFKVLEKEPNLVPVSIFTYPNELSVLFSVFFMSHIS